MEAKERTSGRVLSAAGCLLLLLLTSSPFSFPCSASSGLVFALTALYNMTVMLMVVIVVIDVHDEDHHQSTTLRVSRRLLIVMMMMMLMLVEAS